MCLSKLYVEKDGKREFLMEEIAFLEVRDNKLLFRTLFGEQKQTKANIREIDFTTHSIILENSGELVNASTK